MKVQSLVWILSIVTLAGCSHNPNKAEKINTKLEREENVVGEKVGVKEGNLVVQRKVEIADELRRIQYDVFELEDRVYGNRKYGSKGLYGSLKDCRAKLTSKEMGGDGKLMWTEPLERITDKEEEFTVGIDEKDKIVAVSEEFLNDRLTRFRKYKQTLQKRQDDFEDKLDICDAAIREKMSKQNTAKESAKDE